MTDIREFLHEITPRVEHPAGDLELTYDGLDWSVARSVRETDRAVAGKHDVVPVDASTFEAARYRFESHRLPHGDAYHYVWVTDEATYVNEQVVRERTGGSWAAPEADLERAVSNRLGWLSMEGYLEGLRPVEDAAAPIVSIRDTRHDVRIEELRVREEPHDGAEELVVYLVPSEPDPDEAALRSELRTAAGVEYAYPERVVVVDDASELPDDEWSA